MRDPSETIAILFVLAFVALGAGAAIATGVWAWQNAQDKRVCRQHGGAVVESGSGSEWHCVGPNPEVR